MSRVPELQLIIRTLMVFGFLFSASVGGQAGITVTLSPGDNIQSAVDANPEGTTFVLLPGLYRMQSVVPKNHDIFTGQGKVILNGSQLLSFHPATTGSGLWAAPAVISNWSHGECQASHPLCSYTQDLFIDNVLQTPAIKLEGLSSGSWYLDRAQSLVYITVDPSGHIVELGTRTSAFNAQHAIGVQVSHLTVEKYASAAQQGAIGSARTGTGWIVSDVEVRWNHGAGIELASDSQVLNSFIHHNGQLGISFVGENQKAINNEISWNNYAGFKTDWEAGGGKFLQTTNLVIQGNYVHDNAGTGLWTDTNAKNTLYENNTVVNNLNQGIQHEACYSATIRKNIVRGNGNTPTTWLWNAQILLQSSSDVDVYDNLVEVPAGGGHGIVLINENRDSGDLGPFAAANDRVHDNTITYLSTNGYSGIVNNVGASTSSAIGNSFNSNHYILKIGDGNANHWQWFGPKNWTGLQDNGQEKLGSCCK
jgi:hypothetical protein